VARTIAQKFERFLDGYRRPDGRRWGGQDLHEATGGVVTRSYVTHLRKGRIQNPSYEKLGAIAKAMGFPPELWFEEDTVEKGRVEQPLLDEQAVEALRDDTANAILRESMRLSERERKIVLGIVRLFEGMSGGPEA